MHLRIRPDRAGKVRTVYNGVSARFVPTPERERPDGAGQVLYVGRFDPYKNVAILAHVMKELQSMGPPHATLTIAGALDDRYPEVPDLAEAMLDGTQDVLRPKLEERVAAGCAGIGLDGQGVRLAHDDS